MNRCWEVVAHDGRRLFVKQVLELSVTQTELHHYATRALNELGLPVPAPMLTRAGNTLAETGEGWFAVYPWSAGIHRPGPQLTIRQAADLGTLFAKIQSGLREVMPAAEPLRAPPPFDPAETLREVEHFRLVISRLPGLSTFDRFVLADLRDREAMLAAAPSPGPLSGPGGWTHGDFHGLNVLWRSGEVSAVVDFDRLSCLPYASELVRSVMILFTYGDRRGMAVEQVAAFINAYRAVSPLTGEELRTAANHYWRERLGNLTQLERHYHHDEKARDHIFVRSGILLSWWWRHPEQVGFLFSNTDPRSGESPAGMV
ncbi:Ser/Thr protein kinase RdoA involved in Cpx stress response, MazF antagonist [Amycolatopsis xylanica]|uniref:Ser/Thr protein kinase RdoA involved in Cpx stress response, MazF antagonist n=2 Tax=Amycolatopsis xylanica TaxID=589385 RepID=A0A1H3PKT7_9PSEU|nr:Ser/Thr protein kinase RdoA involved in Cpx stress response, MazF antagonist [Amycolatopsis xylanica]